MNDPFEELKCGYCGEFFPLRIAYRGLFVAGYACREDKGPFPSPLPNNDR